MSLSYNPDYDGHSNKIQNVLRTRLNVGSKELQQTKMQQHRKQIKEVENQEKGTNGSRLTLVIFCVLISASIVQFHMQNAERMKNQEKVINPRTLYL